MLEQNTGSAQNVKRHLPIIESYEITRIILMAISHEILNVAPYNLDIHYCRNYLNESKQHRIGPIPKNHGSSRT